MTTVKFSDTNAGGQAPTPGAAAYAASRLGLRVFPLTPGSGTPALKAWPEIATTDADVIQGWWSGEFAGFGVGVATGPESGVWVLDIDVKNGVDGFASLVQLESKRRAYGFADEITRTMTVSTPSGGAHVYFRWSEGVANSTGSSNRLGPGLDVRGERGYVRAPGWGGYTVVPRGPEGVRVTARNPAPEWLVDLAQKRRYEKEGEDLRTQKRSTSWSRYQTGQALESLRGAPSGSRNDALNKTAFRLAAADMLLSAEAWKLCRGIMVDIDAGDDEDAQRRTFESGWNAGIQRRGNA